MTDERMRNGGDAASRLAALRAGKRNGGEPAGEPSAPETNGQEAFKTLSADRQQKVMLELRFKTGDAIAFAYSYLVRADLNPSTEIVLDFSAYEVRIAGRNLRPLYSRLVAQRVAVVQETDEFQSEATVPTDEMVVTAIKVREQTGR